MARPRHGKLPRAGPRRDDTYRDLNPQAIARAWDLAIEIDTMHRQAQGEQPIMPVIAPRPDDVRWSAAARAMFAEYTEARAAHRPLECTGAEFCWVKLGPPAMTSKQRCLGCGGSPKPPLRPGRPR